MRHRVFVKRRDAIVLVAMFSGFFTPVFAVVQLLLSLLLASTGGWAEDASGVSAAWNYTVAVLMWLLAFQLAGLAFAALFVVSTPRLKYGVLGEHLLEIRDGGLFESTTYNETLYRWIAVDRVLRFAGRTFIQFGGGNWLVLPDRDFADKQAALRFADEVKRRGDV